MAALGITLKEQKAISELTALFANEEMRELIITD